MNLNAVGYVLLVVGIVGLVLSMIFWSSWAGPGYFTRRRTYVDEGPPPPGYEAPSNRSSSSRSRSASIAAPSRSAVAPSHSHVSSTMTAASDPHVLLYDGNMLV